MLDEMWNAPAQPLGKQGVGSERSWPPNGEISFGEILHAINPLQHLPVIGTIYRAITGDTIPAPMRLFGSIVGGLLTGGPIGLATAIVGNFIEDAFHEAEAGSSSSPATPTTPAAQPTLVASAYARADQLGIYPGAGMA